LKINAQGSIQFSFTKLGIENSLRGKKDGVTYFGSKKRMRSKKEAGSGL
jgi:hypothetical protein